MSVAVWILLASNMLTASLLCLAIRANRRWVAYAKLLRGQA